VEQDQLYSFDREYNHIKIIDLFAKRAKRLIEDKNTMTKKNVNLTTEVNQQKNKLVELTFAKEELEIELEVLKQLPATLKKAQQVHQQYE
jgi:ssDNA-specific exonuclease RecJ